MSNRMNVYDVVFFSLLSVSALSFLAAALALALGY